MSLQISCLLGDIYGYYRRRRIFLIVCRSKSLISIVNSIEINKIREKSASGGDVTLCACTLRACTLRAEVRAAREGSDAEHISVCVRPYGGY